VDDDEEVEQQAVAPSAPPIAPPQAPSSPLPSSTAPPQSPPRDSNFSNLGEYAAACLQKPQPPLPVKHVLWQQSLTLPSTPSSQSEMAFQLIDPAPFMLLGAQRMVVHGRPVMRRVIIGPVEERNNNLAIANFLPVPQGPLNFMMIRDQFEAFLKQRNIGFLSIQPCPFGQAYVRLASVFERDMLVHGGPQLMNNGESIFFTPHNRAWNNRTAIMTHEVWIMLLGLNLDLWTEPLIEKAVSSFGRLMIWEQDMFHMARAVVRVRVSSLEDIPWFFVFSEGTQFESNGWCVQCEILQAAMLGIGPQDEDQPGNDDDFNPNNFQFHGFGQPVNVVPPIVPVIHQFNPN